MAGSIAFEVRTAVVDGLAEMFSGLAEFNGEARGEERVEASYAYDHGSGAAERVFTDRCRSNLAAASMRAGRNYLDEDGSFKLVVLVAMPGGSPKDAAERAFAIVRPCLEWLGDRKNNELGVTGLQTLRVAGELETGDLGNDHGHIAEVNIPVAWTARIT